jgi:transposase
LPGDLAVCHNMILELLEALKHEQREREGLQQRLDQLLRRLYGPKAERFDPNQPWLLPELANADANAPPASTPDTDNGEALAAAQCKRAGHGRKKLPADLPRRRLEHTLPEAQRLCPCCGEVCQQFGEEISEQLDYQPASLFVQQHVRFKYACPKCHDHVTAAPPPAAVIDKGLPGPGLLAQIVASKYADHLPLHRLRATNPMTLLRRLSRSATRRPEASKRHACPLRRGASPLAPRVAPFSLFALTTSLEATETLNRSFRGVQFADWEEICTRQVSMIALYDSPTRQQPSTRALVGSSFNGNHTVFILYLISASGA